MRIADFLHSPDLSGKLYLCIGDENYFHSKVRALFVQKFPKLKIQNVEADEEPLDFYAQIESDNLFSDPKLVFINNASGDLSSKKLFEQHVKSSTSAKYVVFGDDVKTAQPNVKIECGKVKDNPKEILGYVKQMVSEAGINLMPKDMEVFYFLYRNDLQTIYNEIQKIQLLNNSMQKMILEFSDITNVLSPSEHLDVFKFSNNFMKRNMKGALNSLPEDDFLPHIGNIFSIAEKLYISKKSNLPDDEIIKNYKFNNYYYLHSIKPLLNLWSEGELKNLLGEMNGFRLKLKESKLPMKLTLKNCIFKYCTK